MKELKANLLHIEAAAANTPEKKARMECQGIISFIVV